MDITRQQLLFANTTVLGSNPNITRQELLLANTTVLDFNPFEEIRKTVIVRFETNMVEIKYLTDPTGLQFRTSSSELLPTHIMGFDFRGSVSTDSGQIYDILSQSGGLPHPLIDYFTSYIATTDMGMAGLLNNFVITLTVRVTHTTVCLPGEEEEEEEEDVVERLVRDGAIDKESLDLGLEQEACSICFENLLGVSDKGATRMPCSHVFHDSCISQWLHRKNSCPLCRRLLYADE